MEQAAARTSTSLMLMLFFLKKIQKNNISNMKSNIDSLERVNKNLFLLTVSAQQKATYENPHTPTQLHVGPVSFFPLFAMHSDISLVHVQTELSCM
jgi:hypothetical protein